MSDAHYGHDLYGALRSGYIRRSREACFKALTEVRGRVDPIGGAEEKPGVVFGLALSTLIQCAERQGIPTATIREKVKRVADRWDESFGGHRPLEGTALLQFDESMEGAREDPVETGNLGWENYDAEVDAMSEERAKETLKEEARLRRQAQIEAADLREGVDKSSPT